MTDSDTPQDDPADPQAFTAVPVQPRQDGWTPERQRDFIQVLADTGSVSEAAWSQMMTAESAYRLRRRPGAETFCRAWAAALHVGVQRLTDIAIERAIRGVPEDIWYRGEVVGERRRYDNKLLMFALRNHDPSYTPGIVQARGYDPVRFHAERTQEVEAQSAGLDDEAGYDRANAAALAAIRAAEMPVPSNRSRSAKRRKD